MVPISVGRSLYKGISCQIEFLLERNGNLEKEYSVQLFNDISESLGWYKINCVVSYDFLKEKYDELARLFNNNE